MMRRQSRGRRLVDMANPQDVVPPIGGPLDIAGALLWVRADLGVTIVQGPVVATGTTPPTVTMTGTPATSSNSLEIDITLTGLRGTATFTWKLNGVVQQTLQLTAATFVLGTTGITANFSAGTYTNDNVYTSVVTVSAWADQGGGGFNYVQATAASQPAFAANKYNGKPAINGIDGTKSMTSAVPAPGTSGTFMLTCSKSSLASTYLAAHVGGAQSSFIDMFTTTLMEWFSAGGADRATFATAPSVGLHQLIVAQVDGVSCVGYFDGAHAFNIVPTNTLSALGVLFGYNAGSSGTNGDIVECAQYTRALKPSEIAQLHAYSRSFWGSP